MDVVHDCCNFKVRDLGVWEEWVEFAYVVWLHYSSQRFEGGDICLKKIWTLN